MSLWRAKKRLDEIIGPDAVKLWYGVPIDRIAIYRIREYAERRLKAMCEPGKEIDDPRIRVLVRIHDGLLELEPMGPHGETIIPADANESANKSPRDPQ